MNEKKGREMKIWKEKEENERIKKMKGREMKIWEEKEENERLKKMKGERGE